MGRHDNRYLTVSTEENFSCIAVAVKEGWSSALCELTLDDRQEQGAPSLTVERRPIGLTKLRSPMQYSRRRLESVLAAYLKEYAVKDLETAQKQAVTASVVSIASSMRGTDLQEAIG
jgi:hypothetical protein